MYYTTVFDDEEKSIISKHICNNDDEETRFDCDADTIIRNTNDNVFLLSESEVRSLFYSPAVSDYKILKAGIEGALDEQGKTAWWTRTGCYPTAGLDGNAMGVYIDGRFYEWIAQDYRVVVRPAIALKR